MKKHQFVHMKIVHESACSAHVDEETGELVIDECKNFDPALIPTIFPEWLWVANELKKQK